MKQLPKVFERFVKHSAVTVLSRAAMERFLTPEWLDELFERTSEAQYTRDLLFSTVFDLMAQTVCRLRKSMHDAYLSAEDINVTIVAVYDKLRGIEPGTSAALVRESGKEVAKILEQLGAVRPSWIEGYRIKLLDGNCLAATDHRIAELREVGGGALPGKSLVVFDPSVEAAIDVFPCQDGHAQERSLLAEVVGSAEPNDVWIADRNFCTRSFLLGLVEQGAHFIIREHSQIPLETVGALHKRGQTDTGVVYEQRVRVKDERGRLLEMRRITVRLRKATRDGDREIHVLTDLRASVVRADRAAELYRKRWTIETVFQHLERNLNSEIHTLGYPKAALFGFCVALVVTNVLAVVHGALRSAHGAEKVDEEFSPYHLASEISSTATGMMIAISEQEWRTFHTMTTGEFARQCHQLAANVRMARFKKSRRGPKRSRKRPPADPHSPHVSTARLIAWRVPQ